MKVFAGNGNDYTENGRRYVMNIKTCSCSRKEGGRYLLNCKIHQRGINEYEWADGSEWLQRPVHAEKLWLSEEAKKKVLDAVDCFEKAVTDSETMHRVTISGLGLTVFFRREADQYDGILQYHDLRSGELITEVLTDTSPETLMHEAQTLGGFGEETEQRICDEMSRAEKGADDIRAEKEIRIYSGKADAEDCRVLEEILGTKVLPPLPEEFNRDYAVTRESIDRKAIALLSRSGYRFWHRPYFAMKGFTHDLILLNPCKKSVIDAAKQEAEATSFTEYLGLFKAIQ